MVDEPSRDETLLQQLIKDGPGPEISHDEDIARRRVQVRIDMLNEKFREEHPNFEER